MPWVTIQWFTGRDVETKKKVAELVTKAICEGCGSSPDEVSRAPIPAGYPRGPW